MTQHVPYRFQVIIHAVDPERKKELAEVLKTLNPKLGKDWVRGMLKSIENGEEPAVHQSNNGSDAYRVGMVYQNAGAVVMLNDLIPEDEEELPEDKVKPPIGAITHSSDR